jgi:hypothetical protein
MSQRVPRSSTESSVTPKLGISGDAARVHGGLGRPVIRWAQLGAISILALCVASICVYIETLNAVAGGLLPRRDYRNDDPSQGLVKWRLSPIVNEQQWRLWIARRDPQGRPPDRALIPEEREQMLQALRRGRANNALRNFVGTFGLAQYVLAPLLVILSFWVIRRGQPGLRDAAWLTLAIGLAAVSLMLYRGYFTSVTG